MAGVAECDASIMDGADSLFGAVGCVSGILNPIRLASGILTAQKDNRLSHGRVPARSVKRIVFFPLLFLLCSYCFTLRSMTGSTIGDIG